MYTISDLIYRFESIKKEMGDIGVYNYYSYSGFYKIMDDSNIQVVFGETDDVEPRVIINPWGSGT